MVDKERNMSLIKLVDGKAEELKNKILSSGDTLPSSVTGNVWYLSNQGDDSNCGCSKESPWKTLEALVDNAWKIKSGDAVLFERGSMFRAIEKYINRSVVRTISGVYYGAYGEGEKPFINASPKNYAFKECWSEEDKNIWTCGELSEDTGIIVFNNGEMVGYKKLNRCELKLNGDFWCDGNKLYLYWDKNPASDWESIEIGVRTTLIGLYDDPIENITIENLCLKYSGGHAVAAMNGAKNITVRNCEIGYIGGSILMEKARYGNGIEFFGECRDIVAEYNWVYQIYDSGITYQGGDKISKNISFCNNLLEYCGMGSFEYWRGAKSDICWDENVTYANNICRLSGYCWGGEQRPDKCSSHIRSDVTCPNATKNFIVKDNIFDRSSVFLIEVGGTSNTLPKMIGNIYIQSLAGLFGTYSKEMNIAFDTKIESFINNYVGDKEAIVAFY